jgi:excisionase family DNA binding protein
MEPKRLLTVEQMAELLQVPRFWIYQRTRTNAIPCIRLGRHLRFDPDEVLAFFRGGQHGKAETNGVS